MTNQFPTALEVLKEGLSFEISDEDPHTIWAMANIHLQVAMLYTFMGYPEKAREFSEESLKYYLRAKNNNGMTDVYSIRILALYYCGRYQEALQQSETGLQMALRLNYRHMIGLIYNFTGFVHAALGQLDKAWECAQRSEQIARDYKYLELFGTTYRLYGDIYRYLRDHKTAAEYYRKGWKSSKEHFVGLDNLARLGYQLCATGQYEEGLKYIRLAYLSAKEMGVGTVMLTTQLYEADVHLRVTGTTLSVEQLEEIKKDCMERSLIFQCMFAKGLMAFHQIQQDQTEQAMRVFSELTKQARVMGDPWVEIASLSANRQVNRKLDLPVDEETARIQELVNAIGNQTKIPQLQEPLRNFMLGVDKSLN
jgi:tetratricopeptide (TPR) repeat protein